MAYADLESFESEAYRDSFSDGLVDLFVGLGLLSIGVLWLWAPAVAGLAGVLAAVVAGVLVPIRSRIVEPRVGHVTWTAPRLKWERKQYWRMFGLGSVALILGVGLVLSVVRGDVVTGEDPNVVAALPAVLFAIGAFVLAAASGIKRLWGYGAVLLIAAVATLFVETGPGGSLLVAGVVIATVGVVLFSRFLNTHPVREMK
jgi:MFS family permease